MAWCPRHSWSEDRPCHTSGAWALDSLLQLLSSPCFPLMGRGSPDCLWNIREWQFHRLFWQQNEKSEDIILLPKARVSPLNTHTHTHTHTKKQTFPWQVFHVGRLSKLPSTGSLKCAIFLLIKEKFQHWFLLVDAIKMNPQWHRQMTLKIQQRIQRLHKLQPSPVPQPFSQSRQRTLRQNHRRRLSGG